MAASPLQTPGEVLTPEETAGKIRGLWAAGSAPIVRFGEHSIGEGVICTEI